MELSPSSISSDEWHDSSSSSLSNSRSWQEDTLSLSAADSLDGVVEGGHGEMDGKHGVKCSGDPVDMGNSPDTAEHDACHDM